MASHFLSSLHRSRVATSAVFVAASLLWQASPAYAQLDPTLFLKRTTPNVLLVVDVANRMERDAPTDQGNAQATSNYYDAFPHPHIVAGAAYETVLGVTAANATYRRRYGFRADGSCGDGTTTCGLTYANGGGDRFNAGSIVTVGNTSSSYATF